MIPNNGSLTHTHCQLYSCVWATSRDDQWRCCMICVMPYMSCSYVMIKAVTRGVALVLFPISKLITRGLGGTGVSCLDLVWDSGYLYHFIWLLFYSQRFIMKQKKSSKPPAALKITTPAPSITNQCYLKWPDCILQSQLLAPCPSKSSPKDNK